MVRPHPCDPAHIVRKPDFKDWIASTRYKLSPVDRTRHLAHLTRTTLQSDEINTVDDVRSLLAYRFMTFQLQTSPLPSVKSSSRGYSRFHAHLNRQGPL